jgi:hypothetical protein
MNRGLQLKICAWILASLATIPCLASGAAQTQQGKVPPQVRQEAEAKGVVIVHVELDVPFKPVGNSIEEVQQARLKAIAEAYSKLLAGLSGTDYEVLLEYTFTTTIILRVGTDALEVLDVSPVVKNVWRAKPARPL